MPEPLTLNGVVETPVSGPEGLNGSRPAPSLPDAPMLRGRVERSGSCTVGVEEEYLLIDPTGDPSPCASKIAKRADGDGDERFRVELPACQIEMASSPRSSLAAVEADLRRARATAAGWCDDDVRPVSAAVHPFVTETEVAAGRAADLVRRYGWLARSQLLGAVQVHVAVGDARVVMAVHDELRAHLPLIAGLAAAAPFQGGRDLRLASVRPFVCARLPRQGIPPAFGTIEAYADALAWSVRSGAAADVTEWWWDLRLHPLYGTLEIRVADAQPTVADTMGVVAFVVALVRHCTARARAGDLGPPVPSWRIDENRRSAALYGLEGPFRDVDGRCRAARDVLGGLVEQLESTGRHALDHTRRLMDRPAYVRLRNWGVADCVDQLAGCFQA